MLIAQITDIHIGFDGDRPDDSNLRRLDQVLDRLLMMSRRPDLLVVTGDIAEHGDEPSYHRLRERLLRCPFPVYPCLGNHDRRDTFARVFNDVPMNDGFVQYVVDASPLRLLVLDTLEEGRHGGGFCDRRANWLAARLTEAKQQPTVLILHHPPIDNGIDWMTTAPGEPWVNRLNAVLVGQDQVVGMLTGHVHRPAVTSYNGSSVILCPSIAPPLTLDLAPTDPDRPDGRSLVTGGPPGFAIHIWQNERLVTHFEYAEDREPLVRFDQQMQPFIRKLFDERS